MEPLVDQETSTPFSSLLVGLLRFRKSLSPHGLAAFIALFPYCHLTGLYHMHGLPLWLPRSRSYMIEKYEQSERRSEHRHHDPQAHWDDFMSHQPASSLLGLLLSAQSETKLDTFLLKYPPFAVLTHFHIVREQFFQLSSFLDLIKNWQKFHRLSLPLLRPQQK